MKYLYILLFIFTGTLVSCVEDDTNDVSSVTNYPIITVNGPSEIIVQKGSSFVDAGAVSVEGENEIETITDIASGVYFGKTGVDTSSPDKYVISYSAINQDGFAGSALRDVWVANNGDLTTNIEGIYSMSSTRVGRTTNTGNYVLISKTGANTYELTHAVGGWYSIGLGYGPGYACRGSIITANDIASNDFSVSTGQFPIWGNTVEVTEFMVDAASKTVTYTGTADFGGVWKVTLTQVQF